MRSWSFAGLLLVCPLLTCLPPPNAPLQASKYQGTRQLRTSWRQLWRKPCRLPATQLQTRKAVDIDDVSENTSRRPVRVIITGGTKGLVNPNIRNAFEPANVCREHLVVRFEQLAAWTARCLTDGHDRNFPLHCSFEADFDGMTPVVVHSTIPNAVFCVFRVARCADPDVYS